MAQPTDSAHERMMYFQPPSDLKSFNLFDFTRKVYKTNFAVTLMLSMVSVLPFYIYQVFQEFRVGISIADEVDALLNLIFAAWALVPTLGIILVTSNAMKQQQLSFRQAINQGASCWLKTAFTYLLIGIIMFVITLLAAFIIALLPIKTLFIIIYTIVGVYVSIYLLFIQQIITLRGEQPGNPFKRSWQLVKGQWWAAFGSNLAVNFVVGIITIVLVIPLFPMYRADYGLFLMVAYFYSIIVTPIPIIYKTLLFLKLEARKTSVDPIMTDTAQAQDPHPRPE